MPINIPSSSRVVKDRVKASIQAYLASSNPFLKGSWLGAIADSFAERVYDFYTSIGSAIDEVFPDTTIENLERWGSFYNLTPNAATTSIGYVIFQSYNTAADDPVSVGQIFVDSNGNTYRALEFAQALFDLCNASSLTRIGSVATFVGDKSHFLKSGNQITISGASVAAYNGLKTVTVINDTTFTFPVDGGAATPATGASFQRFANRVKVISEDYGADKNLAPFTIVNLQTPLTNINDEAFVDYQGLANAQDRETTEAFRTRVLDVMRNPVAHFNESDISSKAKTVPGITRVIVVPASPAAGQVTIYVMTDNEVDPVPGAAKVDEVKNALRAIKPANTSDADMIVAAPGKEVVDFTFTALTPNTSTMRASILEVLKQFFATETTIDGSITQDDYRAVIKTTIDITTGEKVISFALSAPSGTINPASNEIPVLGTVTFP